MSDNLTKIRPGNIKHFEIRCDFCGYTLKGNFVNDIVCRANDLGWRYDYENDVVICRNCQEERKMKRKNPDKITSLRDHINAWRKCERKRNKIGIHQTAFAMNIGYELTELLKPVIPDIDWHVGDYDECGYEVHLESRAIEADRNNPKRQYCLQALIDNYFPELCFIIETESEFRLTAREADRVIKALEKLRRKEYLERGEKK